MSNIASDLITEFYTTRVGGTRDTAALLSLVAAGVMTTPPLAATVPAAVSGLLAALGSAYFTNRFLAPVPVSDFFLPTLKSCLTTPRTRSKRMTGTDS